jgi:hypothetical protein
MVEPATDENIHEILLRDLVRIEDLEGWPTSWPAGCPRLTRWRRLMPIPERSASRPIHWPTTLGRQAASTR